jgi:hypothetical protein
MLAKDSWIEVAQFAAYHCQTDTLRLRPCRLRLLADTVAKVESCNAPAALEFLTPSAKTAFATLSPLFGLNAMSDLSP